MSGHRDLTLDEVKQGLADNSILLVDVREPHEFALARIRGAVNFPVSSFNQGEIAARGASLGARPLAQIA